MMRDIRVWVGQFGSNAAAFVAVILLMFPGSASVLCIAPGGHIAVEDINAPCCTHSAISSLDENRANNGIATAGDCQNCTDLFIAPDWRMAISKSSPHTAASILADECPANHFGADAFLPSFRSGTIVNLDTSPPPVAASVPMRC